MSKEKKTEVLEIYYDKTLRKISGLEIDELNSDGPYVCSQYSKLRLCHAFLVILDFNFN